MADTVASQRLQVQLGLLPAPARLSGQRRYPHTAVGLVSAILLLQDVGFTLRQARAVIDPSSMALADWRESAERKLAELDQRIAHAQAARSAIAHALDCPHDDILECPNFARVIAASLTGAPLEEAHAH